jgi:biopolymer transport protein TolQ
MASPVSSNLSLGSDLSLITLITGASVPVQIVMILLLMVSVISWWYIFIKMMTLQRAEKRPKTLRILFGWVVI